MSEMNERKVAEFLKELNAKIKELNVIDSNFENANVVDVINFLSKNVARVAHSILAPTGPGHDASGGTIASLTEAVMGITAGLFKVAEAIEYLADKQGEDNV